MMPLSFQKHRGFTLVSLMIGLLISAFLLLMVSQLSSLSTVNYLYTQNMTGLYDNAREALAFLRQNIQMAGYGITQPVPLPATQRQALPFQTIAGGAAVFAQWSYIGDFNTTSQFSVTVQASGSTPATCESAMLSSYGTTQFFGLINCSTCVAPPVGGFNKSDLSLATSINGAGCCMSTTTNCRNRGIQPCSTPYYNCGGFSMAVYQKNIQYLCVGSSCAGVPSGITASGDILTVYFSNPGPNTTTTFSGATIPVSTYQPPSALNSYTIYVDSATTTLKAYDSIANTTYNVVPNIEVMNVLVGESDLLSSVTTSSVGTYSVPTVSRYITYNTENLYQYRISAVRVAFSARTQNQVLLTNQAYNLTLMEGNNGTAITYAATDRYIRQAFTTTIFLNAYSLPVYQLHCVNVGGTYYMRSGGIPFATTWTTNDQTSCGTYTSMSACETARMSGGC